MFRGDGGLYVKSLEFEAAVHVNCPPWAFGDVSLNLQRRVIG